MFKNVIAPVQTWLLLHGQCVGCGKSLSKATKIPLNSESEKATCQCGRIFIFDLKKRCYRRALFEEV